VVIFVEAGAKGGEEEEEDLGGKDEEEVWLYNRASQPFNHFSRV
jgi:hypothetical protein